MASNQKYATLLNKRGREGLPALPTELDLPYKHVIYWTVNVKDRYVGFLLKGDELIYTFTGRDLLEARSAVEAYEEASKNAR